jgi:hypothetical protein
MDTDGDGQLDEDEFLEFMLSNYTVVSETDQIKEIFKMINDLGDDPEEDAIHAMSGADDARLKELDKGTRLHVRGIGAQGGKFESEEALRKIFSPFGDFEGATIRHREDASGANTSWAIVTMGSTRAVVRALAAVVTAGDAVLQVTPFSKDQAAASTGAMVEIPPRDPTPRNCS